MMDEQEVAGPVPVRYVALGDSYTIGEGVAPGERWPNRLAEALNGAGIPVELVANLSVTGWTSAQLIEHELPVLEESGATFVTVLIGVNDWVQGVTPEEFRDRLATILDRVQAVLPEPERILLVTIPDFSVTPKGSTYGRGRDIAAGIAGFNTIIEEEAASRALPVADIFALSQALSGPAYVAADGLHPSGAAYARWLEHILPAAHRLLDTDIAAG